MVGEASFRQPDLGSTESQTLETGLVITTLEKWRIKVRDGRICNTHEGVQMKSGT
jgi:hypothetical protein